MSEQSSSINLSVDSTAIPIMWACVKHFEPIANNHDQQAIIASLLGKLAEAMAADTTIPWGTYLFLSPEEGFELDFALHMTMTDAEMAKRYGPPADQYVGKVRLSTLADHIPLMAELLRKLEIATQLAEHEHRLSIIENQLGIVPMSKSHP